MPAMQDGGARHVGHEAHRRHAEQQGAVDLGRRAKPLQGLESDAERDGQQRRAVDEGGDDLEPQQAERPLRGGRALGQVGDDERQTQHTSELQSHGTISYAVFCLKKKKTSPPKRQRVYSSTTKDTKRKTDISNTTNK